MKEKVMNISGLGVLSGVTDKDVSDAGVFVVPEATCYLSEDVFSDCHHLKTVILKETLLSLHPNALNNIPAIIVDTKTDESYNRLRNAVSTDAKNHFLERHIGDFILRTQKQKLDVLNLHLETNPIFSVCSSLPSPFSNLSPYDIQSVTMLLSHHNPKYLKAKFEIQMLPLPRTKDGCRLYERKCQAVIEECLSKFKRAKQNRSLSKNNLLKNTTSFFRPFLYPFTRKEFEPSGVIDTRQNLLKHFEVYHKYKPTAFEIKTATVLDLALYLEMFFDLSTTFNLQDKGFCLNVMSYLLVLWSMVFLVIPRLDNELSEDELGGIMAGAEEIVANKLSIEFTELEVKTIHKAGLGYILQQEDWIEDTSPHENIPLDAKKLSL